MFKPRSCSPSESESAEIPRNGVIGKLPLHTGLQYAVDTS
jgi:hypothetical protein